MATIDTPSAVGPEHASTPRRWPCAAARGAACAAAACTTIHLGYVVVAPSWFGVLMLLMVLACAWCALGVWRDPEEVRGRHAMAGVAASMVVLHVVLMRAGLGMGASGAHHPMAMGGQMAMGGPADLGDLMMRTGVAIAVVELTLLGVAHWGLRGGRSGPAS